MPPSSAALDQSCDEVATLRKVLAWGAWRALLVPGAEMLLTMALLDGVDWWDGPDGAHQQCLLRLGEHLLQFPSRGT